MNAESPCNRTLKFLMCAFRRWLPGFNELEFGPRRKLCLAPRRTRC
jgi:hypothetical protein